MFKVSSYYWRQNDGWLDLDDNERFKRAWVWHLAHCNPPRTLEEFKRICKWVVDTCKTERDRVHAEARQNRDLFARLEAAQAEAEEKQKQKQEQNENAITTTDRLAGNNNDEFSDYENELIKEFHFKTLIDSKDIWYYNKNLGVYEEYGDIIIESKVEQRGYTNKQVAETLGHIRRRTYTKRAAFDSNIEWIACKNCMINLKTGKTAPFDPKFMNTTYLPVIYDPKIEETQSLEENPISSFFRMIEWTKPNVLLLKEIIKSSPCPAITKFLYDIITPADVELLLDFMTYSLWRNYKFHNWILLVGYGQNRKSTFLTLLEMFFHVYSAESLERLLNDRFAPAQLYKKLINIDADISGDILEKASGKLKKLTGNDEFAAETKYKAPFKFRNFAKLYFSCNKIPKIDDKSDAFFRRMIIVNFIRQFWDDGKDSIEDRDLIEKITTEEEFSGLLYVLLKRLPRVLQKGIRPNSSKTMEDNYEKYVKSTDPVQHYIDQVIEPSDTAGEISKDQLYNSYVWFCRVKGLAPETEQSFSRVMTAKKYICMQKGSSRKKNREYYWIGMKIKDWKVFEDGKQDTLDFSDEIKQENR